jgi:hypothetical protein
MDRMKNICALCLLLLTLGLGFTAQAQQRFNNLTILTNLDVRGSAYLNAPVLTNGVLKSTLTYDLSDEALLSGNNDYSVALDVGLTSTTAKARLRSVSNLAALISADPLTSDLFSYVKVLGYTTAGDGGGGDFRRVLASSGTTNRGTFFKSTSNATYAWERANVFTVSPKMFGAKGDFVATATPTGTDDTVAIQAMVDYSTTTGIPITGTPGNYQITSTITVADGHGSRMDWGGASLDEAATYFVNATNTPFLTLLDPSRFEIANVAVYFKPSNGWGLSDANSQPQQNTNAYTFRVIGWGTFLNIHDVSSFYGSGLIQNYYDTNLVASRTEARMFNNNIETVTCRYGKIALDLYAGSGSTWNNLYLNASSGGTTNQTATSAIVVRSALNNELFHRINIEWSGFTGEMMALTNAEVTFDSLHVEGVNFPYQASADRWAITLSSGSLILNMPRIQDLRSDWGSITKFGLFNITGSPVTTLQINGGILERWNENAALDTYAFVRYIDYGGGASYVQVNNLNERDIGWASFSPSWYGFDERPLLEAKRTEIRSGFTHGLSPWSIYYNLAPTAASYITSTTNASGIIRLQTGTNEYNATLMQVPYAGTFAGRGVLRMKARFRLSALPAGSTDAHRFRIGFFADASSAPQNNPTESIALEQNYVDYVDNALRLVCRSGGFTTSSVLVSSGSIAANTWYDCEIIVNNDRSQVRAFLNPRTSGNSANATSNIPANTTELRPQVQLVKRGSAPATNVSVDIDYVDVVNAPNGVY